MENRIVKLLAQKKLPKWLRNIFKINKKNVLLIILGKDCTLVQ